MIPKERPEQALFVMKPTSSNRKGARGSEVEIHHR